MSKKITIALATYQRPHMLSQALISLERIKVPEGVDLELLICDNDELGSAEKVCQNHNISFPTKYLVEPSRGIVFVRNRLLKEAIDKNSQYLAFFDDDEVVSPDWVDQLYSTIIKYNAQAVAGKVIYQLPENVENWLRLRDFYGGRVGKTGTVRSGASTNNVMIDLAFAKKHNLWFDVAFNNSGGSDSFFFRVLRDAGGKIVTCAEAIAYESVPKSRATEQWILNRAYKNAITEFKRNRIRKGLFAAYLISSAYGLWLILCHVCGVLNYPFTRYAYKVFNRRRRSKIKGIISAFRGKDHSEYSTIHGD